MTSKFKGILEHAKNREPEPADEVPAPPVVSPPPEPLPSPAPVETRGPGRPRGKRSDPTFAQVTAYIPEATHRAVKIALLQEGQGREFSELVDELLSGWLKSRT